MLDTGSGCLRWQGPHFTSGYGKFGTSQRAHRVAWEREHGPIPEGMTLDHVWERGCRWRDCVLTKHLEPVTQGENARRGRRQVEQRERTHCPKNHPYNDENTYRHPSGKRVCRACNRESAARYRKKENA